jgi:hypothetical protein
VRKSTQNYAMYGVVAFDDEKLSLEIKKIKTAFNL